MAKLVTGSEALARRLVAIPDAVLDALRPALTRSVAEIAADARALAEASRRSGALMESIAELAPGEFPPTQAVDGCRRTGGLEVGFASVTEAVTAQCFHRGFDPTRGAVARPVTLRLACRVLNGAVPAVQVLGDGGWRGTSRDLANGGAAAFAGFFRFRCMPTARNFSVIDATIV